MEIQHAIHQMTESIVHIIELGAVVLAVTLITITVITIIRRL